MSSQRWPSVPQSRCQLEDLPTHCTVAGVERLLNLPDIMTHVRIQNIQERNISAWKYCETVIIASWKNGSEMDFLICWLIKLRLSLNNIISCINVIWCDIEQPITSRRKTARKQQHAFSNYSIMWFGKRVAVWENAILLHVLWSCFRRFWAALILYIRTHVWQDVWQ